MCICVVTVFLPVYCRDTQKYLQFPIFHPHFHPVESDGVLDTLDACQLLPIQGIRESSRAYSQTYARQRPCDYQPALPLSPSAQFHFKQAKRAQDDLVDDDGQSALPIFNLRSSVREQSDFSCNNPCTRVRDRLGRVARCFGCAIITFTNRKLDKKTQLLISSKDMEVYLRALKKKTKATARSKGVLTANVV